MRNGDILGGRYRLDGRVDSGGMGTVWRGSDTRLNRTVAIKILHAGLSNDDVFKRRFHVEARAVAALQAPNVVNIYDYAEDETPQGLVSYLVMEYVAGQSLAAILDQHGRLGHQEVLRITAAAAEGLHAAHQAGIIHRDVKPANILIAQDGTAKIVDFGIARAHGEAGLTSTGMVMGTAAYVSPEQLQGGELTGASDVYSLGIVAYECLGGTKPFNADNPADIIAGHIHEEPPPLPQDTPEDIARLVYRALAKDRADRWSDAAAFAVACRSHLADQDHIDTQPMPKEPSGVRLPSARGTARPALPASSVPAEPASTRRRSLVLLSVLAAALLAVAAVVTQPWSTPSGQASDEPGPDSTTGQSTAREQEEPTQTPPADAEIEVEPEQSDQPPQPARGPVPDVVFMLEEDAKALLSEGGFSNIVATYWGSGSRICPVDSQYPLPQEESAYDEQVTLTMELVEDLQLCSVYIT